MIIALVIVAIAAVVLFVLLAAGQEPRRCPQCGNRFDYEHIPRDIRERMAVLGVSKPDLYAGRLSCANRRSIRGRYGKEPSDG